MFPLEWWIKWEICDVLYQLALVAKQIKFSGASKLHDPTTNMKLVQIKDKEKLNRIIKNQPITHVTLLFLCEIQYFFLDFIFEERTFLPFITSDHNKVTLLQHFRYFF